MCNINHTKFPCKIFAENVRGKDKLLSVTYVNFGFILNVTTLIIWITGIFKTMVNPGIALNVAAQFFLSTPYQATKTSWLIVLTLTIISHIGKI